MKHSSKCDSSISAKKEAREFILMLEGVEGGSNTCKQVLLHSRLSLTQIIDIALLQPANISVLK